MLEPIFILAKIATFFATIMNKKLILLSILVAFLAYRYAVHKHFIKKYGLTIETSQGSIRGVISLSRDGHEFYEYLGIPYGKAGRFEFPQPADSWVGIRDGSKYGAKCLQIGIIHGLVEGEENCLYLNVFVPKGKANGSSLPVLVYIHGGHFTDGSSNLYLPTFLIDQEVVVVTLNYRLGVLGFLNTGDDLVRGNMGLKDQSLALRWVQTNIASFGGNPNSVTLFGESAGGACVHFHILSPLSKGLFHKAISMSGSSLKVWALMATPREQALRFGTRVGCPTGTTNELVQCLKALNAEDLVAAQSEILEYPRDPIAVFVPSVEKYVDENTFLNAPPQQILAAGNFSHVPFLTGVNSEEGLVWSALISGRVNSQQLNEQETDSELSLIMYTEKNDELRIKRIRQQYFGENAAVRIDSMDHFDNFTRLISDRHFFTGFEQTVKLQSQHSPVYPYYYTYRTETSAVPILLGLTGRFPVLVEITVEVLRNMFEKNVLGVVPPRYGICHGEQLVLFFHIPFLTNIPPEHQDYDFSKKILKLWKDFIYDEHSMEFMGTKWEPVQAGDENFKYLHIDETSSGLIIPPFRERLKFWEELNL